jgi:hypothetical protein
MLQVGRVEGATTTMKCKKAVRQESEPVVEVLSEIRSPGKRECLIPLLFAWAGKPAEEYYKSKLRLRYYRPIPLAGMVVTGVFLGLLLLEHLTEEAPASVQTSCVPGWF